jgi:hypothetical protein
MEQRLTRDQPAAYRIQVQGILGQNWVDYLGGLSISVGGKHDQAVTTLSGKVLDQAALFGILNSLYDMGYPLLCVEYLAQHSRQKGGE